MVLPRVEVPATTCGSATTSGSVIASVDRINYFRFNY